MSPAALKVSSPKPTGRSLRVQYAGEAIPVEWLTRHSSVQRVLVRVNPDGRVLAYAPAGATEKDVLAAIQKRIRWIYRQRRDFLAHQAYITPRRYVSGESHYYLGRQYVLKVLVNKKETGVKLLRGKLEVAVPRKEPAKVRELLMVWYRQRAAEVFARRLEAALEQTLWVKQKPAFRLQAMKTQWGSCSPKGLLTLNPHLVKAPREAIDYVLLHELCHIAEHNHSPKFYSLMNWVMPEWERVKLRLDGMAARLLSDLVEQ